MIYDTIHFYETQEEADKARKESNNECEIFTSIHSALTGVGARSVRIHCAISAKDIPNVTQRVLTRLVNYE